MVHSSLLSLILAAGLAFPGCLFDGEDENDVRVWMSIAPIQCGGNAWEQEDKSIEQYLSDLGVEVVDIKTSTFAEAVCLACICPNGQRIDVLISDEDVPATLDLGFVRFDDWPY